MTGGNSTGPVRLCLWGWLLLQSQVLGQTTQEWRFRNELVPASALAEQAQGLLPMKRDEFERRLQHKHSSTAEADRPRLEESNYRARFVDGHLVDGVASLRFVTVAEQPQPFVLAPLNLAIESTQWEGNKQHNIAFGRDPAGQLFCLVPESGQFTFEWSLAANRTSGGESRFVLQLPPALRRTLEIVTSDSAVLSTDSGIVKQRENGLRSSGEQHWIIDLNAEREVWLTVRETSSESVERQLIVAQEESQYAVRPAALDVQATFALSILEQPVAELKFVVDAPLELTGVRLGGQDLKWRATTLGDRPKQTAVTCYLREPISAFGQSLEIDATSTAGLPGGAKLPRIRLSEAILQEAKITLQSPEWMHLSPRAIGQATKTNRSSSSDGVGQDVFEFLVYGESGGVEITSEQVGLPLVERSATTITIEPNQIVGQFNAELTSRAGEFFAIEAQVPRHWVVDSVETQPPDRLADRSLAARMGGSQRLQLKLTEPITSERALRLSIRAHYRRPANLRLAGQSAFAIANFPAAGQRRRLVSLQVSDPQAELQFAGDDALLPLASENMEPGDRELFPDQALGIVFDGQSVGEHLVVTLRPTAPRYRAEVALSARVENNGVHQEASVVCSPEGTAVGSIALRVSPVPAGRIRWRLTGDQERELSAVTETTGSGESVQRLLLPRSTTAPVTIQGSWLGEPGAPLNLIFFPEAAEQTAIVEVTSVVGRRAIKATRAEPLPTPVDSAPAAQIRLGRFYYDGSKRPEIVVASEAGHEGTGVWVEKLHVKTYLASPSTTENMATLLVQNSGQTHVTLQLPETVSECRVQEPSGEVVVRRGTDGEFEIPLPAGEPTVSLNVRYLSVGAATTAWPIQMVRAPLPTLRVPVLAREWTVGLPPGHLPCRPAFPSAKRVPSAPSDAALPADARSPDAGQKVPFFSWLHRASGLNLTSQLASFYQPPGATSTEFPFRDWNLYTQAVVEGETPQVSVFRSAEFMLWTASVFTLWGVLAYWLRRHPTTVVAAAALGIAGSMLVPAPFSWLLVGAGSGLLMGLLWGSFHVVQRIAWFASPHTSRRRSEGALALVTLAILSGSLSAAPPLPDSRLGRVVIPIDDERRPVGDYVYLEPDLYESLSTTASAGNNDSPKWLIEQSRYETRLGSSRSGAAEGLDGIKAVFSILTFADETLVELPLLKNQVSLATGQALLDQQPASLRWKGNGEALWLDVPRAGRHQLELTLAARVQQERDASFIEMSVPRAAISSVICSGGATEVDVVRGFAEPGHGANPRVFRLLDTSRLLVRWNNGDANSKSSPASRLVEQLDWWRVRGASMVLETQFKLTSRAESIDRIPISVDPRLRLISSLQSGPIARVESDPTDERGLTVHLAQPAEEVTVRMSWLWEGASGMGRFLLPRVEVREGEIVRHWSAISVDPSLRLASEIAGHRTISIAEFTKSWTSAVSQPSVAFQHSSSDPDPVIGIEPVVQRPRAEQIAEWSVSAGKAQVQCTFQLSGVPANCFEHSFTLPAALKVNELTLLQSETAAAIRWWQQSDGRVRISLLNSPQTQQEILLRAEMKFDANASRFTLPQVRMDTADVVAEKLCLYRQPDARVSMDAAPAWQPVADGSIGRLKPGWGRLVAVLQHTGGPQVDLTVPYEPNRPSVAGTMVTSAAPIGGDWQCQLLLEISTTGGLLDQLRFLVPEDWKDDLRIEPAMQFRFDRAANEDRWLLTVEPEEALTGRAVLKLTSSLSFDGGGVHVPDVQVLGFETLARLVLLAGSSASPGFDWEIRGLTPISMNLDEQLRSKIKDDAGSLYRVSAPRFRAVATYQQDQAKQAEILLLENETLFTGGGKALTTSTMIVNPVSNAPLRFELPPQCRFVQAAADGLALACERVGVRTWQLPPASAVLPYELRIIYEQGEAVVSDAQPSILLASPKVIGLKSPPALWIVRIEGDSSGSDVSPVLADQASGQNVVACSWREAELMRLEAYAGALDVVQSARAGIVPKPVLAESFLRYEREALTADRRLDERTHEGSADGQAAMRRRRALESISAVRQRLFQAAILSEDHQAPISAPERAPIDRRNSLFKVPTDEWIVRLPATPSDVKPASFRWSLAAVVLLGAMLLMRAMASMALEEWIKANRGLVLVALGVLWWMLAPLGWLGWLLVALGAWVAWQQVRRFRMRPADSYDHGVGLP